MSYIYTVNGKGKLADYFERNYLKYQMENGRMSLVKFAEILKFSKSFLSQLLEGKRTKMTYHTARFVADTLGDYEIMDILNYERPDPSDVVSKYPPAVRSALANAVREIESLGISPDSDEAVKIFIDEVSKLERSESS